MQVFDGHNDALSRLWATNGDPVERFSRDEGHVNSPACRAGSMGGGFFALYSPEKRQATDFTLFEPIDDDEALPPALEPGPALQSVIGQAAIARSLHDQGAIEIVTDAPELGRAFMAEDRIACILHLEGADCIDADLLALDALYALGLRSLGPVWSRPTIFGEGVPFGFNRDGDTGSGLTVEGRRLVARCQELGVVVDTSHLTFRGFWDIAEMGGPVVATHSNAYALCPATRNLTDDQLRAIGQTGGIVGLNFATLFLSEEGWRAGRAGIDDCIRHLAHMVEMAGEDAVTIGSDFDGAPMPQGIASARDLPKLIKAMREAGFGEPLVAKIAHENWLGFLSQILA